MADSLVPYVYEDALYGHSGRGFWGSGNMPALTVGALLLRLRRLVVLEARLSPAQRDLLSQVVKAHEAVRAEWKVAYVEKLHREGASRLKAMHVFFEECHDNPRQCRSIYLPEAHRRAIVQEVSLALTALGEPHEELARSMRAIDGKLRRVTEPAEFLWEPDLAQVYPQPEFWWLYAIPPLSDREPAPR